jgi:phage baseplate assembly protein W
MDPRLAPRVGWPLLPVPDGSGRLSWPDPVDSILQSIRVLLLTRPGEQLMRPRFGAGLQRFVGRPDTIDTRRAIQETVQSILVRHETRILVDGVDVLDDPTPGHVRVEIRFRVRRTGTPRRLGLTIALENG